MFAFALWDAPRRRLLIARDRLGKKPLYYTHQGGRLLFASELKALLADKSLDLALDYEAFSDYLSFLCIIAPKTPFRQIRKLPPAHYLVAEGGAVTLTEYWDPNPNHMDVRAQREIEEELFHQLDDAVACRLESEVPLGAFLSGGVDSSASSR
jgi:asparagine synthase (glutamine-hydrolysing)